MNEALASPADVCKNGHQRSAQNVRVERRGGKACRVCNRLSARRSIERRKGTQPKIAPGGFGRRYGTVSEVERIGKLFTPEPNTGCWLWTGAVLPKGYGVFGRKTVRGSRQIAGPAHRASYELFRGPIPKGLHLDHLCRQPSCVNPDHLEAVTPRENNARSRSLSAVNAKKTHCLRGHELAGTNLYRRADKPSHRGCVACRLANDLARNRART